MFRKKSEAPRPDAVDDGIHSSNFLLQKEMEEARLSPLAFISRSAACGPSDHTPPISSSRLAQGIHEVCSVSCLKCVLLSGYQVGNHCSEALLACCNENACYV